MVMASQANDWCEEELSFPAPLTTLCSQGHHASLLLCTTQGGHMCLACFSDLLSQRSAFVIHKAYALTEFLQALQDDAFCSSFLQRRHFLVPSLSEALYRCTDEGLAEAIMEAIQRLCRLASGDTILLNDFIAHLSLQLASQVLVWSCGQRFVLHSLGSLIDLHGRHAVYLPEVLRAPEFFLSNLLSGLRLPGDDIRGEILFVLYKLSSLQEGINELLKYCPQCIHLAVNALLKTEDDELRTNGIAFLSVMAQSSVFDIGLVLDDEISSQEFSETATTCESTLCFAKFFAEAMKGSLMSTDIQVQVSSIQLICQVCPVRADLQNEIRILVEAGISEYIFEILRVSEDILQIANVAIGALITLSAAGDLFTQRLVFGVEAVIRVLESFIEPNWMVQKEAMLLLAANISDIPGLLTAGRAESLFLIIKKVLEQHASLVEDLSAHGGGNHLYPEKFAAACSAFIALLKVPCCYGLDSVPHVLLLCARSAIASATTSCRFAIEHIVLRSSACILQEASKFSQKRAAGDSSYCTLALSLLDLFEIELLPTISICFENLEEEETALAFIDTCLHFLQSSGPSRNVILAEKLASKSWCSLLYQSMNCFPSTILKKSAYDVLSAIIESLAGKELGQLVKAASQNLPSDPIDLLTLMEQNSSQNSALMSTQYAIFAIIYTSHLHNDRLAHEYQILASLDHFIVVNGSNLWNKSPLPAGFGHFVFLYALLKETLDAGTQPCSNEAEKLLIETIKQSHGIQYISSKTPKPVLKWFFCKEPLKPLVMEQLLSWFTVDPFEVFQESRILDSEVEKKNSCSQEWRILSELAAENGFVVKVLVQLFEKLSELLIDKETQTIAFVYIDLMRFSPTIAAGFRQNGLVCSIRSWILKYGSKACASTIMSIFQLLFLLLQTMTPGDLEANGDSWLDIANQAIHLLLWPETVNMRATAEAPSYLYVICLIISKSLESDILAEASYVLCFNKDLLITLWSNIINGIKEPSKLSQLALVNPEEEIICLSLVFHMLWLRVALKSKSNWLASEGNKELIGFASSCEESLTFKKEAATHIQLCKSLVTVKHLCQVLHYGSRLLKILSSSCLVLVFSQLAEHTDSDSDQNIEELNVSIDFIKSILLVLQASALHDCQQISKNASFCLYWLISTKKLKKDQRWVVERSPWYRFLVEELMRSLAAAGKCPVQGAPVLVPSHCIGLITIALSVLKISPSLDWLPSVFSPQNISAVIDNLSAQSLSHWHVCLFMELMQARHLQTEDVEKLRMFFQASRRTLYKSPLCLVDQKTPFQTNVLFGEVDPSDITSSSHYLQLILEISLEQFMRSFATRKDLMNNTDKKAISEADLCTAKIDEFLLSSVHFQ